MAAGPAPSRSASAHHTCRGWRVSPHRQSASVFVNFRPGRRPGDGVATQSDSGSVGVKPARAPLGYLAWRLARARARRGLGCRPPPPSTHCRRVGPPPPRPCQRRPRIAHPPPTGAPARRRLPRRLGPRSAPSCCCVRLRPRAKSAVVAAPLICDPPACTPAFVHLPTPRTSPLCVHHVWIGGFRGAIRHVRARSRRTVGGPVRLVAAPPLYFPPSGSVVPHLYSRWTSSRRYVSVPSCCAGRCGCSWFVVVLNVDTLSFSDLTWTPIRRLFACCGCAESVIDGAGVDHVSLCFGHYRSVFFRALWGSCSRLFFEQRHLALIQRNVFAVFMLVDGC